MRKIALLFIFVLVFLLGRRVILADEEVPSDLALDLAQAEKNPAPQRQQIIADEALKAEETTNVGRITVQPEMQLAPEVARQSASLTEHPEQTTSAQVQETTAPADTSTNQGSTNQGSTNSGGAGNLVPGTTVIEPDDNAAPLATPSLQTAPKENKDNNTQQQPNQPADNSTTQPNPPNDNSAPSTQPAPTPATDNSSQQQNETPPVVTAPSDTQPDSGNSTNSNDSGGGSAVQGASTEKLGLFGKIVNFFRGLINFSGL